MTASGVGGGRRSADDVGLVGLGVMGRNLALNLSDKGYRVFAHDRDAARVRRCLDAVPPQGKVKAAGGLSDLVASLDRPRRVLLLVTAGAGVDALLEELAALLDPGDILVDLGNSHYLDSERRSERLRDRALRFVGSGISGGEQGARWGASLMPGGDETAWPFLREMFTSIAASADGDPCVTWIGAGGAGHYVKMVHNGLEYAEMQLIAESYDLLRRGLGLDGEQCAGLFRRWNETGLESYLIDITAHILTRRDDEGGLLLDRVLDVAAHKGTGVWATLAALEQSAAAPLMAESVCARFLSALKQQRLTAGEALSGPAARLRADPGEFAGDLQTALLAARAVNHAQGFALLAAGADRHGWRLDFAALARIWRAGCVIRSAFLDVVQAAFGRKPELSNLLLDEQVRTLVGDAQRGWRRVVADAILAGLPLPTLSSALAFYDGLRSPRLPADLLQAQRDCFGAHGYERTDRPRGGRYGNQRLEPVRQHQLWYRGPGYDPTRDRLRSG